MSTLRIAYYASLADPNINENDTTDNAFQAEAYAAASGKPYCGYNSSNGCCGLPSIGGNCNPSSLNFANLGTNNPCPGCYSLPGSARHHCCPQFPPYNGGGPCVCSGGYGGGSGSGSYSGGGSGSSSGGGGGGGQSIGSLLSSNWVILVIVALLLFLMTRA